MKYKKNNKKIIALFAFVFFALFLILSQNSSAQEGAYTSYEQLRLGSQSGVKTETPATTAKPSASSSKGTSTAYTPMEKIPGMSSDLATGKDQFKNYVEGIYKFGIWTIGIAALLMIMIGGFMYMTSAGNNATMGKAKGYITDAIIGLVMAMTAYVLLYTINPDLVNVNIKFPSSSTSSSGTGTSSRVQTASQIASNLADCKNECSSKTGAELTACNSACDTAAKAAAASTSSSTSSTAPAEIQAKAKEYAAKYGVPENVALNMLKTESGGVNGLTSSKGASGLLQLMPGTARDHGVTDVMNVDQNLNAGYQYASEMYKKYGTWEKAMAAYNWGPQNMDSYLKYGYGIKGPTAGQMPKETRDYVKQTTGGSI